MIYRLDNFIENRINPITNQPYDDSWIVWQLTYSKEYKLMVGSFNGCAYTIKFSRYTDGWEMSVCDFMEYNKRLNKNMILVISETDLKSAEVKYKGHSFDEPVLRKDEQEYTVHSTSLENWQLIQKCDCLKSWNILKAEGVVTEEKPIGNALGDPADFSNYKSGHTRDNAFLSRKVVDENGLEIKTALIVCKAFHARRCLMLYQMAFPDVEIKVCPIHCYNITKDNWYKTEQGINRVLGELARCGNQFVGDVKEYLL